MYFHDSVVELYVSCLGVLIHNVILQVFEHGYKYICFVLTFCFLLFVFINICIVQRNCVCLTWKSTKEIKSLLLLSSLTFVQMGSLVYLIKQGHNSLQV